MMLTKKRFAVVIPAVITLLLLFSVLAWVIFSAGGDPLALARLGTRFSTGDPNGTEGYDGQFVYYIARDLFPAATARYLDIPAYRYQRILLPLLARGISFGNIQIIPWTLAFLGLLSQTVGTLLAAILLSEWGTSPWYSLIYGLWAGFSLAARLDLPEPLAYSLVLGAILAEQRGHPGWAYFLFGLALFAKEVVVLFILARLVADLFQRRWMAGAKLAIIGILPYALFQLWLWNTFGQPGLGSGGAMATSFEIIPFMGLFRIGGHSRLYLLAMLLVFGPSIILPSLWGGWIAVKSLLAGKLDFFAAALGIHACAVAMMPFSTFRETGGVLRFACGLVAAVVLYAGKYHQRRALNYGIFWVVLNVFLFKS